MRRFPNERLKADHFSIKFGGLRGLMIFLWDFKKELFAIIVPMERKKRCFFIASGFYQPTEAVIY
jgi:hypothetical protein